MVGLGDIGGMTGGLMEFGYDMMSSWLSAVYDDMGGATTAYVTEESGDVVRKKLYASAFHQFWQTMGEEVVIKIGDGTVDFYRGQNAYVEHYRMPTPSPFVAGLNEGFLRVAYVFDRGTSDGGIGIQQGSERLAAAETMEDAVLANVQISGAMANLFLLALMPVTPAKPTFPTPRSGWPMPVAVTAGSRMAIGQADGAIGSAVAGGVVAEAGGRSLFPVVMMSGAHQEWTPDRSTANGGSGDDLHSRSVAKQTAADTISQHLGDRATLKELMEAIRVYLSRDLGLDPDVISMARARTEKSTPLVFDAQGRPLNVQIRGESRVLGEILEIDLHIRIGETEPLLPVTVTVGLDARGAIVVSSARSL